MFSAGWNLRIDGGYRDVGQEVRELGKIEE